MSKYKREETKRKHADTIISLGEKFFYAGYITPLIIFIKYGFTLLSSISSIIILISFSSLGQLLISKGLKYYDRLKD